MVPAMTCPDCGAQIAAAEDLLAGRRVHRLAIGADDSVVVDREQTVTLRRCADCDLVVVVS